MANKTIIELNPVTPSSTAAIPIYENGGTGRASASQILRTQDILYADDEQEPTSAVSFESVDTELTPASSESVELLNGSDTWGSRFYKISQMFKNVRYLLSKTGTTDFSSTGNTTTSGAIKALDTKTSDIFTIKAYNKEYTIAGNTQLTLSANDFNVSTPQGYTGVAATRFTSSRNEVYVRAVNARATGTIGMLYMFNTSSSSLTATAYMYILYVKTSLIDNIP